MQAGKAILSLVELLNAAKHIFSLTHEDVLLLESLYYCCKAWLPLLLLFRPMLKLKYPIINPSGTPPPTSPALQGKIGTSVHNGASPGISQRTSLMVYGCKANTPANCLVKE